MFGPGTHAHPAKLVLALFASHVIATTVLLNGALTFATLFRIAFDPVCRLAVIAALLQPHLRDITQYRSMVAVDVATKTKLVLRVRPT